MAVYGTGIVVSRDRGFSYVATVAHTFKSAERVYVHGTPATIVARKYDDNNDLAILKVKQLTNQTLYPVSLVDPKFGDDVALHGLGAGDKFGRGDYSFKRTKLTSSTHADIPSRHGDSGGPIFNSRREVCGLIATTDDRDTGFIPASRLRAFIADCRCVPNTKAKAPPPPREDIPDKEKTDRIRDLEEQLAALKKQIESLAPTNGQDGRPGKDGKDAEAFTLRLISRSKKTGSVIVHGTATINAAGEYDLELPDNVIQWLDPVTGKVTTAAAFAAGTPVKLKLSKEVLEGTKE
jgi:putative sterol carrier protein